MKISVFAGAAGVAALCILMSACEDDTTVSPYDAGSPDAAADAAHDASDAADASSDASDAADASSDAHDAADGD